MAWEIPSFDANGAIERVATNQRVAAIKELPFQGQLWVYQGPQFADDGSIEAQGSYELTKQGRVVLGAGAVGLLAVIWMVTRG
ncbi:MAG: hypothetical protein GQ535_11085 [Rhodobacteraceae bacterium]|nr:hypothetical protein [Paracoccaceae bacterium]